MNTVSNQNQVSQSLLDSVNGVRNTTTSEVDEAQDRFMTLLVTQMRNQDPLNPMDNAQVTSQMAQLSTVSGINKLNDTLDGLISSVQLGQTYQAANMIGHSVLVNSNTISTDGSGNEFGIDLPAGADSLEVNIKNSSGVTVRALDFGNRSAGTSAYRWDGLTEQGNVAPSGDYQLEVVAKSGSNTALATTMNYAKVLSVSSQNGSVRLNLSNNTDVGTTDVLEVR